MAEITPLAADRVQRRYRTLKQPPLRPPPWIFGPVWTVLYSLMGYAAYRAWNTGMTSINPRMHDLAKVCPATLSCSYTIASSTTAHGEKRPSGCTHRDTAVRKSLIDCRNSIQEFTRP